MANILKPVQVRLTLDGHLRRAIGLYKEQQAMKNIQQAIIRLLWQHPVIQRNDQVIKARNKRAIADRPGFRV